MRRQWQRITAFWSVFVFGNRAGIARAHTSGSTDVFGFSVLRSGAFLVCCLALMSFRLMPDDGDKNRLIYDVRGAFVAAQPEISHRLMQMVHSYVSESIDVTSRATVRPRVVLTIRLASVKKEPFLLGARSSARVVVRAASVTTGEVIAEAKFTATVYGLDKDSLEGDLAYGVASRVIQEFQLAKPAPATLATALFP